MAALVSCPKHNMVACLEKTERNAQFHEIVDFLTRSSIYYSLTVSPTVSTSLIEQFWNTATSKTVNDVSYIKAKVAGKTVSISKASIRRDLLFNDVDGIDCLTNQEIYENLQLMGYEGDLTILTFQKALFSPQWKYLIHTLIHCLSSKSTSWDQFPTNIASALICLATDRNFIFSKMIFEGMIRNLDAKKQFLMYPRFVQVFLNNQLSNLPAPLDNLPIPVLTKKVFTNMAKQGLHFSGHVTPLFPNMLAQAVVDEGEGDQPPVTESSYRPDTTQVPRDSLEGTNRSKGDQVLDLQKAKDVQAAEIFKLKKRIKHLEKKWEENAKSKPTLDAFDDLDADLAHGMDYMETEEAMNEGRQSNEIEELNLDVDTEVIAEDKGSGEKGGSIVSTARPEVSTTRPKVDTASPEVDTARPDVDAARQEVSVVEPRAPPTTTNVEDSSRPARSVLTPKPLSSIDPKDKGKAKLQQEEREEYTIEEKAKFLAETIVAQRKFRATQRAPKIRSRPPNKSQIRNLMMTYLKNMGGYKHSKLKAKTFEEIQAMHERQKKKINDFKPMDSDDAVEIEDAGESSEKVSDVSKKRKGGPRMKRMSKRKKTESDLEEEEDLKTFLKIVPDKEGIIDYEVLEKRFPIINWESKFYHYDRHGAEGIYYKIFRSDGSSKWIKTFSEMVTRFDRLDIVELYNPVMQRVHTLTLEDGTEIHMLAERKYPLTKETLERMMSLKLIDESASDGAYDLLRFIQRQIDEAGSYDEGDKDL
ncbi:hypothetical protein Tco_0972507 [Tanacetum coccineum]